MYVNPLAHSDRGIYDALETALHVSETIEEVSHQAKMELHKLKIALTDPHLLRKDSPVVKKTLSAVQKFLKATHASEISLDKMQHLAEPLMLATEVLNTISAYYNETSLNINQSIETYELLTDCAKFLAKKKICHLFDLCSQRAEAQSAAPSYRSVKTF